ncbi:MAG: PAS domain S-box protein [Deltaproteobacteria bacterium]|nr:PAS domain S-box protein [Deltaproteobacteria bacterium]
MKKNVKKVLIVDDNSTNLYLLKSILEEEGLEVIAAKNGQEALDRAHADPPDLIVSDILMPVMDGYLFCRKCKEDEHLRRIPFIFYTATYTEPKDEKFALSLGANRFVLKPQEPETLIQILKEIWEERSAAGPVAPKPLGEEMAFFRQYNEVLFRKLEKKMLDLETANQELRLLEERYRLSFEHVTDVIYTIGADINIISISPSVERILGYKPQDFIGRPVSDLGNILTPESFEQAVADTSLVLKGETISATVYRFIAKDGTIKYGEVSGSPMMRDGKIIGIISVARDITDRKRAEEKLRESEKKYRELFDFLPIPVYEMDFEANITSANRAIYKTFGGTEEDLKKGFKTWQLLSPEEVDKSAQNIQRLLKGEQVEGTEYTLKRLDGSVLPAIVISSVIFSDGKPVGLRGAIVDITERRQTEETLKKSESKYRLLAENINDVIFVLDMNLNYTYISPSVKILRGYEPEEALKQRPIESMTPSSWDLAMRTLSEVTQLEESEHGDISISRTLQLETMRKDGTTVWTEVKFSFIRDENQQPVGILGVTRDIAERKQVEDALRENEARFRSYFELPLIGIAITSPAKGWLMGNDRLSALLGYSFQELQDMTWAELTQPEDLDADVEQFNRVLAGEIDSYMMDKRFIRKNGEVIWVRLAVGCVRKRDGEVSYFVALFEDITDRKESYERLRKSLRATVQAIAVTVETRDPYTAGHQRRVADLARAIATEMNLSSDQIESIRMAATIHDLGKISVPAEILSKPTKLTELEFSLIKTHVQSGYNILKDIEFSWPVARMVLEHHERIDGSGYPNGLKADHLLLESRILSVADVVEAMASHRPYRPALGVDNALNEITKNKGVHYDSEVVDACLRLFHEKNYRIPD